MRLLDQVRGSAEIGLNLRGDRRIPYLPREQLDAVRDGNVRAMVAHAASNVPFYRDWFAREGADAREIRTAGDLERLPLLDKHQVREEPRLFLAEGAAARGRCASPRAALPARPPRSTTTAARSCSTSRTASASGGR